MNPYQEEDFSQQIALEEVNTQPQAFKDYLARISEDSSARRTLSLIQYILKHGSTAKKKNKRLLLILLMYIPSTHLMERHLLSDILTNQDLSRFILTRRKIQRHLIQEILKADTEQLYLKTRNHHPPAVLLLKTPLGRRLLQRSQALRSRIDLSRLEPDLDARDLDMARTVGSDTHSVLFWSGYLNINQEARKSIIEDCSIRQICGLFLKKDHSFLKTLSLLKDKVLDSLTSEHHEEDIPNITSDHIISQRSNTIGCKPIPSAPPHDLSTHIPPKDSSLEQSKHRGSSV